MVSAAIVVTALLASTWQHARASAAHAPPSAALIDTAVAPTSRAETFLPCGWTPRKLRFGWLAPGDSAPAPYTRTSAVCLAVFTVPDPMDDAPAEDFPVEN
jgi:hypothetical protein